MVSDLTHMIKNPGNAAKEQSDFIHKGLEHALYQAVQEGQCNSIKSVKGKAGKKNAVDFFMARRERCDKFVKESIAPTPEEKANAEAEAAKKKAEALAEETKPKKDPTEVEVKPISGQIKLPPMYTNPKNNATCARPFSEESLNANSVSAWQPVNLKSPRMTDRDEDMIASCYSDKTSVFGLNGVANGANGHGGFQSITQNKYKPVSFMNFKPQIHKIAWREDGCHAGIPENNVNDILEQVRAKEKAEQEALEAQLAEANKEGKAVNYEIGLSKVSLRDGVGRWRPTGQSWGKQPNTENFYKSLGITKKSLDGKPIGFANANLQAALDEAGKGSSSKNDMVEARLAKMSDANVAARAECVKKSKQLFHPQEQ